MGYNNKTDSSPRRPRCWGTFRRRYNWSEHSGSTIRPVTQQQQAGNEAAGGSRADNQMRYTPYAVPFYRHRGPFSNQLRRLNMERYQNPQVQGLEGNRRNEPSGSWFKIIVSILAKLALNCQNGDQMALMERFQIPFGIKYDEKWLVSLLQKECSVPFTPVEFHYEKMEAQFFVQNASIAFALKNLSGRIWDEDKEMISIFVTPCDVPNSVQRQPQPEMVDDRKLTTDKGCDVSQLSLDIQRLGFGPRMDNSSSSSSSGPRADGAAGTTAAAPKPRDYKNVSMQGLEEAMMKMGNLSSTLQDVSIAEDLSVSKYKVKPATDLRRDNQQGPEEVRAEKASLHTVLPDKRSGVSNPVLEMFPKLMCMGGHYHYPFSASNCTTQLYKTLPICKGGFFISDAMRNIVLQFLHQYFAIYDYGDRRSLLNAYHDKSCFSLSIPFNPKDPTLRCLYELYKDSRNMKKLTDPYLRVQLLKYTKHEIVRSLCMLPKSQHDLSSFVVDIWVQTETMLCFSVYGVFREVEGGFQGSLRAFTRTFITIPENPGRFSSSLSIINDELSIRLATPIDVHTTYFTPVLLPASCSMPLLSQEQHKMVNAFSAQFGISLPCSYKCLHDSGWDYARAVQVLSLPTQGTVKELREGPHTD